MAQRNKKSVEKEAVAASQGEEALHAQRLQLIGSLVSFISHDFNNVLTIILGCCNLALDNVSEADKTYFLQQIQQGARRAAQLVGGLLTLSRQGGKPEVLDPYLLFHGLEPLLGRLLSEHVPVKLELEKGLWHIRADLVWLEQAILNLILNAVQASKRGKEVFIRARNIAVHKPEEVIKGYISAPNLPALSTGEYLLIEVEDHGSGIPKNLLENVFQPFFTTKSQGNNTGIGLASVSMIVEKSQGHMYVKSKVGQGSTFMILLPRIKQQEISEVLEDPILAITADNQEIKNIGKNHLVVLVEDEQVLRALAKIGLKDYGYDIHDFASAEEALDFLHVHQDKQSHQQDQPVILVTDLSMPTMDGYTLLQKATALYPNIKTLMLSGVPLSMAIGQDWRQMSDIPHMLKPFTVPQLATKIRQVLDEK